ncbi:MAG: hypothetical protein ACI9R3_004278 [Verrucomicrobiales bacterium]|jgi:hypothetical protein
MLARYLAGTVAWSLLLLSLFAIFDRRVSDSGMSMVHLHVLTAVLCGTSAAISISWRRSYLYCLFISIALLIPVGGSLVVLLMGVFARRECADAAVPYEDPLISGIPLRESTRLRQQERVELCEPFVSGYRKLEDAELSAALNGLVELEDAPLMSLNRKFRDHSDTRTRLVGQACLAERLNKLEGITRDLEERLTRDAEDLNACLDLCEVHLAILDQRLLMPQEFTLRANAGLKMVRRLQLLDEAPERSAEIAFYEARFALHSGQTDRAAKAWDDLLVLGAGDRTSTLQSGDQFHLLGAEISLLRGDLPALRRYVKKFEPDTPEKFWMQEFWLEPQKIMLL